MGRLQIDILGTSFNIQTDESNVYLEKLLNYYKDIMGQLEKSTSVRDPLQLSILTGLSICDELYKEKTRAAKAARRGRDTAPEQEEAERITIRLIERIDSVL